MSWWPWGKSPVVETKSAGTVLGIGDTMARLLEFGINGSATTPAAAIHLYNESSAVSVPINGIAEPFSGITPVLMDRTTGEMTTQHPAIDLINSPSPYYDRSLFLETLGKNYLITNESYVVMLGNISRPPLELQPISPKNVSVMPAEDGASGSMLISGVSLTGNYTRLTERRRVRYIDGSLRELTQIRGYSTKDNGLLRGESKLVSAAAEARQHIQGNKHNISLLENGGRLSLMFHNSADLDQDDYDVLKSRIKAQFGGNAGAIGVTSGGDLTVEEFGVNNKDMDFAILQDAARTACALTYRYPLPLINVSASTLNNYREAKLALYDDAVLPLADKIFTGLSHALLPRFGLDRARYVITYNIDEITALKLRRNEELKLRKELAVETDNELRQMIGREPLAGGDDLYKPANMVPVGTDLFTNDP